MDKQSDFRNEHYMAQNWATPKRMVHGPNRNKKVNPWCLSPSCQLKKMVYIYFFCKFHVQYISRIPTTVSAPARWFPWLMVTKKLSMIRNISKFSCFCHDTICPCLRIFCWCCFLIQSACFQIKTICLLFTIPVFAWQNKRMQQVKPNSHVPFGHQVT